MLEIFNHEEFNKDLLRVYEKTASLVSFPKKVNVNLTFVSSEEIRALNKTTRDIDKVTDVLTYPYVDLVVGKKLKLSDYKANIDLESGLLTIGDIYICLDKAKEQAKEFKRKGEWGVCNVRYCDFKNCIAVTGGAIASYHARLYVSNCTFTHCHTQVGEAAGGGAIYYNNKKEVING